MSNQCTEAEVTDGFTGKPESASETNAEALAVLSLGGSPDARFYLSASAVVSALREAGGMDADRAAEAVAGLAAQEREQHVDDGVDPEAFDVAMAALRAAGGRS